MLSSSSWWRSSESEAISQQIIPEMHTLLKEFLSRRRHYFAVECIITDKEESAPTCSTALSRTT